jgi:N-acetylmuramoyl-L-alanine amidase
VLTALLAGQWSAQAAGVPARSLSLAQKKWPGLQVRRSRLRDQLELSYRSTRAVLVPGMSKALVNDRLVTLSRPVSFINGELLVPAEVLSRFPVVRQRKAVRKLSTDVTVVLDPGHGGRDPGAIGYGGIREKDVNLTVALLTRKYLQAAGVKVAMTRSCDTFPSLQQRADMANRVSNSLFISIHANAVASNKRSTSGIETFVLSSRISDSYRAKKAVAKYTVKRATGEWLPRSAQKVHATRISREARDESVELAQSVQKNLIAKCRDTNRGVRPKNLHVLRESFFNPAILVELGFLTHPQTARRMRTVAYQRSMARGIADGVLRHLRAKENQQLAAHWKKPASNVQIARR